MYYIIKILVVLLYRKASSLANQSNRNKENNKDKISLREVEGI